MRRIKWMLAAVLLAVVPATYAADIPAVTADQQEIKAVDSTAFAADLYGRLASREGNLFFSPASIETALAMTYAGARGDTAAQMAKTLHYDNDAAKVSEFFTGLLKILSSPPEVKLADNTWGKQWRAKQPATQAPYQLYLANALWGQQSYRFKPEFIDLVQKKYAAGLNNLDFAADPEHARGIINDWVAAQTKDRIKDLIPEGDIDHATRLVLTNAIYFKSKWAHEFSKDLTKDGPFQLAAAKSVDVPFMHQMGDFGYAENEDIQLLEMPYIKDALSMVVLLPKKVDGLAALEKDLTAGKVNQWLKDMTGQTVEVTFPKFTFTSSFELEDSLAALGMTDAFDPRKADFSGMTAAEHLYISAVIHKAFVAVDEEQTEAAAATAVVMAGAAPPVKAKVLFKADHPFIFLIRHNATGEILFLGRLVDPNAK